MSLLLVILLAAPAEISPGDDVYFHGIRASDASNVAARQLTLLVGQSLRESFLPRLVDRDAVNTRFDLELTKDALGCDDVSCMTEIAGTLNAPWFVYGVLQGGSKLLTLNLTVQRRSGGIVCSATPTFSESRLQDAPREVALEAVRSLAGQCGLLPETTNRGTGGTGTLAVRSKPAGAAVFVDNERVGITPLNSRLPVGEHRVSMILDGYETANRGVVIERNGQLTIDETLVRLRGTLRVAVSPTSARCFVEGRAIERCVLKRFPARDVEITVRAPHHRTARTSARVVANTERALELTLEPDPVKLLFTSEPPTATIQLSSDENSYSGKSGIPLEVMPGEYSLVASLPGYVDEVDTIKVEPGPPPEPISLVLIPGLSETEARRRTRLNTLRWGTTGVAVGAIALWAVQGSRARSIEADLEDPSQIDRPRQELIDSGESAALTADISLAVSLITTGLASYFWFGESSP